MMGVVGSVVYEAILLNPITTGFITLLSFVYTKVLFEEIDIRTIGHSYTNVCISKQFYRVFSSCVAHTNLLQLVLNCTSLWSLRQIEQNYGSFYYLRYSVLLVVAESTFALLLIHLTIKYTSFLQLQAVNSLIGSLNSSGCSGLCIAWIAFQALSFTKHKGYKAFQLFGIFGLDPGLAPIVMITLYYLILPRSNTYSNFTGLIAGYMLGLGTLEVLPSMYWSLCFLLDVALVASLSCFPDSPLLPRHLISSLIDGQRSQGRELMSMNVVEFPSSNADSDDRPRDRLRENNFMNADVELEFGGGDNELSERSPFLRRHNSNSGSHSELIGEILV